MRVSVVIPARNEEGSVGAVVREMLATGLVGEVVVTDNGSRDGTAAEARAAGATVVSEPRAGYGRACLAALAEVRRRPPEVVVFVDADRSDDPADLSALLAPLVRDEADLVIGSRVLGQRAGRVEAGALLPQARWGNALACALVRLRWGARFTDLGPFRAIRWDAYERLGMRDETFGWTVEMQVRAVRAGLRTAEVPVAYRKRVGKSQITGTLNGTVRAGTKILWTVGAHALRGPLPR
ncbi:UDP-glucose--dolichyl-phosphate glucosyltransferase [Rubrivirga sp. SAORIC476]|uniref:glycosyltransferase family 2 protein n=1 Tax=Rubrivirga sp. SAORIC476 TaxID=1961794 RepID=UPI000BA907A1|nr:glycosyltransferase family 2 protein [Rubrivirga sp. SAORIC476]PAP81725.1 UDP-glucose--dolichyl-phosphate glucosyltransferase [Rubrivirga sp. SAORIC476]